MTAIHGRALRAPASATAIQGPRRIRNFATDATVRVDRWHDSPRQVAQRVAMARWQAGPGVGAAQRQPGSDQPQWQDNRAYGGSEAWHDNPLFVTENEELRANGATAEQQAQAACATLLGLLAQLPDLEGTEAAVQGVRQGLLQLQADLAVAAAALQRAATAGQGVHEAHAALLDSCRALPSLCDAFVEQATIQARLAHAFDLVDERDLLLGLARDAFAAAVPLRTATRPRPVAPRHGRQGHKDRAHGVLDVGAVVNDAGGGMGGGAVSVADIATGALNSGGGPMSAVVTPLGGVLGGIGVVFGAIGLALGANAARRGHSAERRLARLAANGEIEDANVRSIAAFAQEKKRKKKWGGAIGVATGAGAIVAGTLALVAVGVATMGIGALVLGVAAAGTGLAIVLGKYIHRKRKRKAFQTKLPGIAGEMLAAARDESPGGPLRQVVADYGVAVADWNDPQQVREQRPALAAALAQRVESRRMLMAQTLVNYVVGPPSAAMFDAELVLTALHLEAHEVQRIARQDGVETAVARVADKMKSW